MLNSRPSLDWAGCIVPEQSCALGVIHGIATARCRHTSAGEFANPPALDKASSCYPECRQSKKDGGNGGPLVVSTRENGPFYAVKIYPGDLGTFAGPKTDALARVLRADGSPIEGLYAVGADMAHIMGGEYMSGGANLGPALAFGYIAGEHLAAV